MPMIVTSASWLSSQAATLPSPVTDADYYNNGAPPANKVELGRLLFFDKIISGNKNISCGTCHHPIFAGGDGLSVSIGEGGVGLGTGRNTGSGGSAIKSRIGRNSPGLFNLGAKEFTKLNWQGRHQQNSRGLSLPCSNGRNNVCPTGLENVIAGQNIFPLVNIDEMPGQTGENDIINAVPKGTSGVNRFPYMWEAIMARLRAIPDYVTRFQAVFPDVTDASKMKIQHLTNALAAFEATAFRADNSPFDDYLRGNTAALTSAQVSGMNLFYGSANCASCHSGKFQTDQNFHAIAMPQLGPGVFVSGRSTAQRDVGRYEVTGSTTDKYKFRTPSLRNVAVTAPYGHSGAYATLEAVIRHHLDPVNSFKTWDRSQGILPAMPVGITVNDFAVMDDSIKANEITSVNQLSASNLSDSDIGNLIEFLNALTDQDALDNLMTQVPATVPSGLPVAD
ncbi:MAG: cytochrome-c peroxidase [Methylosarcina sp.]